MDRSEGALLVAEKAIEEIKKLHVIIGELQEQLAKNAKAVPDLAIDENGDLVVAMGDGALKRIGRVRGKDGKSASEVTTATIKNGNLVLTRDDGAEIDAGTVVGEPGAPGRDGIDGVGFDDLDVVESDDGLSIKFVKGEAVKEFPLAVPLDRGVWREKQYRKGAGVTWGGSFWIAQRDTKSKPDTQDSGWRLAVKRGRDGREVVSTKIAQPVKTQDARSQE